MKECSCEYCKQACEVKPGWFMPGEVEKVAEFLDMDLEALFEKCLGVDWWVDYPEDVFLLAPATTRMTPGKEYPADPRGQCVFYANGLCSIHPVKPYECKELYHDDKPDAVQERHAAVADAWREEQALIEKLLGHKPVSSSDISWWLI